MTRGDNLLKRMRVTKHGWKPADVAAAYRAAGFVPMGNSKHDGYYHPSYPELMTTVTRSDPIRPYIIETLVALVDRARALEAGGQNGDSTKA